MTDGHLSKRCLIVAELATGHGGDVDLAADMIKAASDAGADLVKLQTYSLEKLNPTDPQKDWLTQSHLDEAAHVKLLKVGQDAGIEVFSTPFDADSLAMLRRLGLTRFKIASSESSHAWWEPLNGEHWVVSCPWGKYRAECKLATVRVTNLTAIPLYPTPLEAVSRAKMLDGWSDHCVGLSACTRAVALGAQMVEVHFCIPGLSRQMPWDKSPSDIQALRDFSEDCATMTSGVSERFRTRWTQ